jgi:hypothetical protein
MKKKPLHLKEIDTKEDVFFYFKIDPTTYVLYDSDMGEPVAYGTFNLVGAEISKLPLSSTIYYFEFSKVQGWRLKKAYRPDKTTAEDKDKTGKIEAKKAENQEDKSKK